MPPRALPNLYPLGYKYLQKHGWVGPQAGLGKKQDGRKDFVPIGDVAKRAGLGWKVKNGANPELSFFELNPTDSNGDFQIFVHDSEAIAPQDELGHSR